MRAWRRDLLASSLLFPRVDVNHMSPRPSLLAPLSFLLFSCTLSAPHLTRSCLRQTCRRWNDVFGGSTFTERTANIAWTKHTASGDWTLWILVFLPSIFSGSTYSLLLLQSSHRQWLRGQRAAPSGHNSNTLHDVHLLTSRFSCSIKYSALNRRNWIKPGLLNIHFCVVFLLKKLEQKLYVVRSFLSILLLIFVVFWKVVRLNSPPAVLEIW